MGVSHFLLPDFSSFCCQPRDKFFPKHCFLLYWRFLLLRWDLLFSKSSLLGWKPLKMAVFMATTMLLQTFGRYSSCCFLLFRFFAVDTWSSTGALLVGRSLWWHARPRCRYGRQYSRPIYRHWLCVLCTRLRGPSNLFKSAGRLLLLCLAQLPFTGNH